MKFTVTIRVGKKLPNPILFKVLINCRYYIEDLCCEYISKPKTMCMCSGKCLTLPVVDR